MPQVSSHKKLRYPIEWGAFGIAIMVVKNQTGKVVLDQAEHHDGFSMWDSKVNEWNSVALGPKLNLAKLHAEAIRKKGKSRTKRLYQKSLCIRLLPFWGLPKRTPPCWNNG